MWKSCKVPVKIWEAFESARASTDPGNPDTRQVLLAPYEEKGIHLIPLTADTYPPMLRQIHDPPVLLFVQGNPRALVGKTLAFVGTRRVSEYGKKVTDHLIQGLKGTGLCVVSGLAQGVDGLAHQAALKYQLPTVAVFGCGLDVIYPRNHKDLARAIVETGGALVSEYPLGTPPTQFTFPQRNRIVAGLSYGVVVVEGNIKSGSLITARLALEENRQVYTVPGNLFSPGSEGPHHLLKQGAVPVTEGPEILEDLNWIKPPETNSADITTSSREIEASLSEPERKTLACIGYDPTAIEHVQQKSGFSAPQVAQALTMLELNGLVVMLPGAKVCRQ